MNFWLPLPKKKGPYTVRTMLTLDGRQMATHDTGPIR